MSTDLEFRQDLLQLRLPSVRTTPLEPQSQSSDVDTHQELTATSSDEFTAAAAGGADDQDECSTPTSEEHRIPAILSCPPAPKKQRLLIAAAPCKRKLDCGFKFYKPVSAEEIEEFFRATEFKVIERNSKRKCPM